MTTREKPLTNQVAVITGAGQGIGAAIATKLAAMGATVVLCGRTLQTLQATATAISETAEHAEVVECDVTDLPSVEALAAQVRTRFKRTDILVNNAGVGTFGGPLHQMPTDAWDNVLNTNLRGVYYCIRSFADMMISAGQGHIINISSLAGKNALPNGAAYAASKWALNGLTYSVAEELRGHGIRVSVICPGSVDTDFSAPRAGRNTSRMLQADDVAHVVAMVVTQGPQSFASEVLLRPTHKP
jgi:NAD(P)-dependent dehydrogenase (short-subunit alcohol dehydrogenase family)